MLPFKMNSCLVQLPNNKSRYISSISRLTVLYLGIGKHVDMQKLTVINLSIELSCQTVRRTCMAPFTKGQQNVPLNFFFNLD